ncbi:hypothetical protein D3C78_1653170 [compost metagenome]
MGLFEQVEDVHHRLDRAGVEVQQAQIELERAPVGVEVALHPGDHLAEQLEGVFRVGVALHRKEAGLPVAMDRRGGLGAGYAQFAHHVVPGIPGSDHRAQAEECAAIGLFFE